MRPRSDLEATIDEMGKLAHRIAQAMNVREFSKFAKNAELIGRLRESMGMTDEEIFGLACEIFSLAARTRAPVITVAAETPDAA